LAAFRCVYVALKFPCVHDFITELCWHSAEVLQNQENENILDNGKAKPIT